MQDAQSPPELSFNNVVVPSPSGGTYYYLIVGLDIDAPYPSFGPLGPILHWIQPGLKPVPKEEAPSGDGGQVMQQQQQLLKAEEPFVANYIGPAPPPGSAPHRYVFFLFEQPAGFDGKKYAPSDGKTLSNWHRMRYDLDAWRKEINLGPLLAANYFTSN